MKHTDISEDLLATAWAIIANAGGGNWDRETREWREVAVRWRDRYFGRDRVTGMERP